MFYLRIIRTAIRSLRANLMRSVLAMLGVIIGVAAVVAAMAIIEGASRHIFDSIKNFGSNVLMVYPGTARSGGVEVGKVVTLKVEDAAAIEQNCSAAIRAVPEVWGSGQVKYFSRNMICTVLGATKDYQEVRSYHIKEGRFFNKSHVKSESYVVVLGYQVAKELFGQGTPLGFAVKIRGKPFTVIGVMEKKGSVGLTDVDKQVIIPVTTAMKRLFGLRSVSMISVQATSAGQSDNCSKQISRFLRKRHRIAPGQDNDFTIGNPEAALEAFKELTGIMSTVFYSIAGISLVVGGIGIMNIMLVSVTERTREIGVRMAVGAQRLDILTQFLAESGMICLVGGGLGVLCGVAFSNFITGISRNTLETVVSTNAIVTAITVALFTGVISGLYPAYKASRLDPVEALRYE